MSETFFINIFIIISLVLMAGYFFGRKKNQAIAASAINALNKTLNPDGQKITNIGGMIGYHVEMSFSGDRNIRKVKGTLIMLPRHSLLYLPVSMIFGRFDRFFITITVKEPPTEKRAHILEKRFFKKHRRDMGNNLQRRELHLGSRDFIYMYKNNWDLNFLKDLINNIDDQDKLKEISIRPDESNIELLIVPTAGENKVLASIIGSISD